MTPDSLFYGLAGYTQMDVKATFSASGAFVAVGLAEGEVIGLPVLGTGGSVSKSESVDGIVLGVGMETRITENISLKGEYRYSKFDKVKWSGEGVFGEQFGTCGECLSVVAAAGYEGEVETSFHDFTVSLAYRF